MGSHVAPGHTEAAWSACRDPQISLTKLFQSKMTWEAQKLRFLIGFATLY